MKVQGTRYEKILNENGNLGWKRVWFIKHIGMIGLFWDQVVCRCGLLLPKLVFLVIDIFILILKYQIIPAYKTENKNLYLPFVWNLSAFKKGSLLSLHCCISMHKHTWRTRFSVNIFNLFTCLFLTQCYRMV